MFKKKCPKCKKKIDKSYDFCPFCGRNFNSANDGKDYGFLGKNDLIKEGNPLLNSTPDSFIDKIFNTTLKMLENQIKNLPKELNREMNRTINPTRITNKIPSNLNVQFFVNGKKITPQQQRITNPPIRFQKKTNKENLEKFSKLSKKEPISKIRRLSGKLVYELAVPGVTDINNVLINQLENSIEIKAASKKNLYTKTININLPIMKYKLFNGNLILELQAK